MTLVIPGKSLQDSLQTKKFPPYLQYLATAHPWPMSGWLAVWKVFSKYDLSKLVFHTDVLYDMDFSKMFEYCFVNILPFMVTSGHEKVVGEQKLEPKQGENTLHTEGTSES